MTPSIDEFQEDLNSRKRRREKVVKSSEELLYINGEHILIPPLKKFLDDSSNPAIANTEIPEKELMRFLQKHMFQGFDYIQFRNCEYLMSLKVDFLSKVEDTNLLFKSTDKNTIPDINIYNTFIAWLDQCSSKRSFNRVFQPFVKTFGDNSYFVTDSGEHFFDMGVLCIPTMIKDENLINEVKLALPTYGRNEVILAYNFDYE